MHTPILSAFLAFSRTALAMCSAGILLFLIAVWAARADIARARGLDKIVAASNLCFAIPLAVFGALHLSDVGFVLPLVPSYMPWRLFWAYFVGCALLAASVSIATKIQVRWSGLLFGIMMLLFVAMLIIQEFSPDPETGLHGRLSSAKAHSRAEPGILRETRCVGKAKAGSLSCKDCSSSSPHFS